MRLLVLIFSFIGLVFFFSASYYYSLNNFNNPYSYFLRFFVKITLLGLILFFIGEYLGRNFIKFKKLFIIGFFLVYFLILLSFIPQFRANPESARWIKIGFISFQPSEIIKPLALIFFIMFFSRLKKYSTLSKIFIFIILVILLILPIYLQPALSNVLIILASISTAFFALLNSKKEIFISGLIIFIVAVILVGFSTLWSYRVERFLAFFTQGKIHSEKFFQVEQSIFAISSGGLYGKGIGKSDIKITGLPQMLTDFIFAIYAEETGFIGSIVLIILYLFLIGLIIYKGLITKEKEKYAFALGCAVWISSQTFLHLASNTGLFVPTGVVLPFLSYGPSGQSAIYFSLGIINGFKK